MKTKTILRAIALTTALALSASLAVARSTGMIELGRQNAVTADARPMTVDAMRKAIIAGGSVHGWKPVVSALLATLLWPLLLVDINLHIH